ncbi:MULTISPECIES: ribosome hibernation-promoting factor, HPF/YfiA family [Desulfococcus]|jgi:putative sigma-54 modulation protein|uniref:Ribosome hibernation promoting factor n=1 Tax=Desulfococcus multivorans DSM 2059 TaxID=1121405 RepID=S7V2L1_DESML|nr:ribosome-associated translation inhibitor RaiA [Desulfococcus multivorans]AOY57808.1 ribosomal protein S30Ae/sigma54 modulation protein [Desulfococcus multivorans]AQV00193.1 ribosomal subunit interface protein [Desulfococcus multivorans]EPR38893.1 sigma 54 modulation protein/ribosomal protein S30EA [Desulfococcus multivorans DSM 2059]SJZ67842.1 SSU ribosomal protein S30P [Desulfococcus multivorans DSM 2059]
MQTSVTFKNIDPSDHLKAYVGDKLNRFDRFLDNPAEASVVLSVEKFRHIAEINITGDRLKINGKEETNDMYSAIDMVMDKLEKQIKRSKQKIRDRRGRGGAKVDTAPEGFDYVRPLDDEAEIIVKTLEYKPMDAEEAVMQLDLADDNFIVFTNARTDRINVVYRRNDGHYGLIQPQ